MNCPKCVLYIFSGLPGTGKTTLAKNIAQKLDAVYFRLDTIEQGLRDLCNFPVQGEGYRLAYRIIKDNLEIGNNVVVDSCNPLRLTRHEYENTAEECNSRYVNIEIICSNKMEHQRRIETRESDIDNFELPSWEDVVKRHYDSWGDTGRIIIDTAGRSIENCTAELLEKIQI